MDYVTYFLVPMAISTILYFPVSRLAIKFGIYAKENERTIHHGKIPRVGGVAIFLAFISCAIFLLPETREFEGLITGAVIIFLFGLADDIFDLKPIIKIIGQFLAATAVIFIGGVYLSRINLPFGIVIEFKLLSYVITYLWIIGIINAVNLIDGLDGLAGGFSVIVLLTICLLATKINNISVIPICLILAGSIMGFLFFNFHPARIFMGDCGSQLLGFCIASISLYGFKSTTFITLFIPILLLFVPIADTFLAIIRRKLKGQSFAQADKGHLHHMLMNNMRLGQVGACLAIYLVTAVFGFTAYLYVVNARVALVVLGVIILLFDLFIEYTGMVSKRYRPILGLLDKFKLQFDREEQEEELERTARIQIQKDNEQ